MSNKWRLINYFDVWGNEKDGWEVNNTCVEFSDLVITDDATDKDILNYLKEIGFLSTSDRRRVRIADGGDRLEIEAVKGYRPLGALERIIV